MVPTSSARSGERRYAPDARPSRWCPAIAKHSRCWHGSKFARALFRSSSSPRSRQTSLSMIGLPPRSSQDRAGIRRSPCSSARAPVSPMRFPRRCSPERHGQACGWRSVESCRAPSSSIAFSASSSSCSVLFPFSAFSASASAVTPASPRSFDPRYTLLSGCVRSSAATGAQPFSPSSYSAWPR